VKSGLLQDLFDKSKFDNNNFVSVKELGDWGSGSTPSKDNSDYWEGRIPWLAPKDVFTQDRNRIKNTEERLTKLGVEETNLYPKGSIAVVVRSGVLDRMLPVAKTESEMAVNQDIKMLVPDSANPDYLLYAFEAYSSQIRQRSRKQGTTWVDSIQMLPFMRFELPIPSSDQQKEIVDNLRPYDDLLITEKEYLNTLKGLKQGLMQDLLSGEVHTHDKAIELVNDVLQHG
jgi:type I restriction enzyme S subunit